MHLRLLNTIQLCEIFHARATKDVFFLIYSKSGKETCFVLYNWKKNGCGNTSECSGGFVVHLEKDSLSIKKTSDW